MLSQLIADEQGQGEYLLDLRANKTPYTYKDSDVFAIEDLDGVYDYVEGSEDWFVDIYTNTIIGKYPHADYTGSTLTSTALEEALKSEPMSAIDKFDARLEELGIYHDWRIVGGIGRIGVETKEGISIFVHEGHDDEYSEFKYPPMSEMQKNDDFRYRALAEFYDIIDDLKALVEWVISPTFPCPLAPVDVYFIWNDYKVINFEDDEEPASVAEYIFAKETEEHCIDCDEDVMLSQELKVQKCPNCGKWIVPCSACPLEQCQHPCPLERMASILNK